MNKPLDKSAAILEQIISLRNQMADCATQLNRIRKSENREGKLEQIQQLNNKVVAYWTEIQILRERAQRLNKNRE
jgi:hypothetical protein